MKKFTINLFFFLSLISFSNIISAQNIPNSVMPEVGDMVQSIVGEADNIDEGDSGNGITWDYTALAPMPLSEPTTTMYVNPDDTPHAAAFPMANLVAVTTTTSGDVYSYYIKSNNKLEYIGGESFGTFSYFEQDPQLILDVSLSGSDVINDTYSGFMDIPSNAIYTTGLQDFEIDATGTLILPSGVYDNAVRMVNTVERTDSSGNATFTSMTRLESTSYMWMIPGQVSPVLVIVYTEGESETIVMGQSTITEIPLTKSVVYNPAPETETTATHNPGHITGLNIESIYPNPSRGLISVDLQVEKTQTVFFTLSNILGQEIMREEVILQSGDFKYQADLSMHPDGPYFLSVYNGKEVATSKIVKE